MSLTRRTFCASAGASWLAAAAPSDRIHLGLIGAGVRGTRVMAEFQRDPSLEVRAVCDVYEPHLERGLAAAKAKAGRQPNAYRNYKQILEDETIQAVLIASPEDWHHRMVLDALAAGKDVYVETPLCQTPEQGVELADAGRRSNNIVQVGMQQSSSGFYHEARKVIAEGTLGNVRMVRSEWRNKHRLEAAHVCGGISLLLDTNFPLSVVAAANRPHRPGAESPESVVVTAEYPGGLTGVFSILESTARQDGRNEPWAQVDGDKARLDIWNEGFEVFPEGGERKVTRQKAAAGESGDATRLHVMNFLECVRTRRPPAAPMSLGLPACLMLQMADLSLRQGRRMHWDRESRKVVAG